MIIDSRAVDRLQQEADFLSSFASTIHSAMVHEFGDTVVADCQRELADRLFTAAELLSANIKSDADRISAAYANSNGHDCGSVVLSRGKITVNQSALELVAHLVEEIMAKADDSTERLNEVHSLLVALLSSREGAL